MLVLGHSDLEGIVVNPGIVCLLFWPSDLVRIAVNHGSIDEGEVV